MSVTHARMSFCCAVRWLFFDREYVCWFWLCDSNALEMLGEVTLTVLCLFLVSAPSGSTVDFPKAVGLAVMCFSVGLCFVIWVIVSRLGYKQKVEVWVTSLQYFNHSERAALTASAGGNQVTPASKARALEMVAAQPNQVNDPIIATQSFAPLHQSQSPQQQQQNTQRANSHAVQIQ